MYLGLILEMIAGGFPDRTLVTSDDGSITAGEFADLAWATAGKLSKEACGSVAYLSGNGLAFPVALFGAACAGTPCCPLNCRRGAVQRRAQIHALRDGTPLPGIELDIRDDSGRSLAVGESGLLWVRGPQIAGEYAGGTSLDSEGWFATKDLAHLDDSGFLYLEERADDIIIRGGENVAPAEIEDVLPDHPSVTDVAVIGVPDDEWGQRIAAVVVSRDPDMTSEDLRDWARARLRSAKTPDVIEFRPGLPRTDSGKVLRRSLVSALTPEDQPDGLRRSPVTAPSGAPR